MDSHPHKYALTNKENGQLLQKSISSSKASIFKTSANSQTGNQQNENIIHSRKSSLAHSHNTLNDGFKTPLKARRPDVNKRVPLGGKDKNIIFHNNNNAGQKNLNDKLNFSFGSLSSLHSSAKKRSWRSRTPKKKLNVLRDDDNNDNDNDNAIHNEKVNVFKDDELDLDFDFDYAEIENVPEKKPPMPDKPLNYEPFTDEELLNISKFSASTRLFDLTHQTNDSDADSNKEFPISFSDDDEEENDEKNVRSDDKRDSFHFMEPTFVSNARKIAGCGTTNKRPEDTYTEGLSMADLYQLIEDQ